ncbi:hypothetical protein CTI12_AA244600 [Artemisia annua]|uniref:Homologous recombination OB-fold protein OB-fold domain-containing protein n=1 Tax=Artemisia annua TaxID=35608 RepID=A0A2U1NP59_ARTAN|nr:hypothetical protein CTI12_AA244600 [Artemisia annua]
MDIAAPPRKVPPDFPVTNESPTQFYDKLRDVHTSDRALPHQTQYTLGRPAAPLAAACVQPKSKNMCHCRPATPMDIRRTRPVRSGSAVTSTPPHLAETPRRALPHHRDSLYDRRRPARIYTQSSLSDRNYLAARDLRRLISVVRIIPGLAGIVQAAKLRKLVDIREGVEDAVEFVNAGEGIVRGCFGDNKKFCKNEKLDKVVAVIKSSTLNALGDLTATLKDPSSIVSCTIHHKVLTNGGYGKAITNKPLTSEVYDLIISLKHRVVVH